MLAKQAWRLLQDPNSLFGQVFKSRYFLNTDFLNATKGTRPSYASRNILFGRDLLKQGLQTVIGNGEKTNVWIDKWIFDGHLRRPMNIQPLMDITLKVHHLIDPVSSSWNMNMLRELFHWKDIQIVLRQKPVVSMEDSLCWALTRNGVYTVKSGYDFISNQVHHDLFKKAEENPSLNPLFLKIWNLHTVPKIKNFLWRLLNGSIAVEDRLRTRGLKNADGCLLCGSESETINHVMFQCSLSRQVWAMSLVPSPLNGFGDSLFTNLAHLFDMSTNPSLSPLLREISPWILWALWKNRNKNLFEGIGLMTNLIIAKAFEDCQEWCLAQENLMSSSLTHKAAGAQNWNAPRSGDLKCNIGYAWSKHHQVSRASWVVRNSNGIVLLHSRRSYSQVLSLFDAKFRSWKWALSSMNQHHLQNVTFGFSSYEFIQALHKPKEWPMFKGHIAELLSFTKDNPHWFILMEPPECNRGAFEIAKSVISGFRNQSYVAKGAPRWLQFLFDEEMRTSQGG